MTDKPLTIILVRHGRTAWNREGRFQGWSDMPLDGEGEAQAESIARRLVHRPLDAIHSSDLARALATAQIIGARHRCPLSVDPRLRELSFGEWEGMTYSEIAATRPDLLRAWQRDPSQHAPPGGETLAELADRVESVWRALTAASGGQTIAVVAHGGPLQMLICLALELPLERFRRFQLQPGSLSEFAVHSAEVFINRLNEVCDEC